MKRNTLINSNLSYLIATLGHTDEITICDAGLPIPKKVKCIDLALTRGIPSFIETVRAILSEIQIEGIVIANEFSDVSPKHYSMLATELEKEKRNSAKSIPITYVSHTMFKLRTHKSRAIIRTGEFTPYANVILQSGVVF